jgi:hypothetical protein
MALSGAFMSAQAIQSGALKWGTGVNPVHAIQSGTVGRQEPRDEINTVPVVETDAAPAFIDEPYWQESYEFDVEPESSRQTTTSEIPGWDLQKDRSTAVYPYPGGMDGSLIRSQNKGADATNAANVTPDEESMQGWQNKPQSSVEDAIVSAPSQYEVQTSMQQRDATKAGSQRGAGSASEYRAPMQQVITPRRAKAYSEGRRLQEMFPYQQDEVIRPFWARTAGTANQPLEWGGTTQEYIEANPMTVTEPATRVSPPDPYQGEEIHNPDQFIDDESSWY